MPLQAPSAIYPTRCRGDALSPEAGGDADERGNTCLRVIYGPGEGALSDTMSRHFGS